MLDKAFVEEKIIELTKEIRNKECYLRFAKQQDVREALNKDIEIASLQRDLYLSFYDLEEMLSKEKEENKEESE